MKEIIKLLTQIRDEARARHVYILERDARLDMEDEANEARKVKLDNAMMESLGLQKLGLGMLTGSVNVQPLNVTPGPAPHRPRKNK